LQTIANHKSSSASEVLGRFARVLVSGRENVHSIVDPISTMPLTST
jgi:hypothetical protein